MHAIFCARGVPDFRKFCKFFARFFHFCAKFAASRRWTRALSCIRTHIDSQKSCNEELRFGAITLTEFMQLFWARRAEKFRKLCNSFARVGRKNCVIPTLDVCFSSDLNAMLTRSTPSDVVRYAQLTIDECTQFFVRGACRISGNLANFSRDFCAKFASSRR